MNLTHKAWKNEGDPGSSQAALRFLPGSTFNDWASVFEDAHAALPTDGSGSGVGSIHLTGLYPVSRTVRPHRRGAILGTLPLAEYETRCSGIIETHDFEGDYVVEWDHSPTVRRAARHHSNFGARIQDLHVVSLGGAEKGCLFFQGAQQASGVERVYVTGFGGGAGLTVSGDTYDVRNVFARSSRRPSMGRAGVGFYSPGVLGTGRKLGGHSLQCVNFQQCTSHNNDTAIRLEHAKAVAIEMESELTRNVLELGTYAMQVFLTGQAQHNDAGVLVNFRAPRWDSFASFSHRLRKRQPAVQNSSISIRMLSESGRCLWEEQELSPFGLGGGKLKGYEFNLENEVFRSFSEGLGTVNDGDDS